MSNVPPQSNQLCSFDRSVGLFLTSKAGEPWFKILTRWIHKGSIDDPGKDFFVEDNQVIDKNHMPLEYSDDYWDRRYSIKPDQIPAFIHSHADKILRTGKYLNVIQQCHGDAKSKYTGKRGAAAAQSQDLDISMSQSISGKYPP